MKTLPPRSKVKPADCWDLSSLYPSDAKWETAFKKWEAKLPGYKQFAGTLAKSAKQLAACLEFDLEIDLQGEQLGNYAFLKTAEDVSNSTYQDMSGRYRHVASQAGQLASYIRPEIMAIPAAKMKSYLAAPELKPHRLTLERILRYKPHTLGEGEERLLAMQAQMSETSNQVFRQLNDSDLKFGTIKNEKGETVELSTSSFSLFLHSPKRSVRKAAFHQYYEQYAGHENTLAAALGGSIQRDVYYAKARGYESSLGAALFHDDVPASVYDSLIESVHRHLPTLYRYFEIRRRKMKLPDIHHYDTYVPILSEQDSKTPWNKAVKSIITALEPLGKEYCGVLEKGLNNGWCDRYPNKGKQSGAFSSGGFTGQPYILMNYQPDVLDHVFTLAHEAGHSMHSYYSAKHQPFQYYGYTIFVAEVASTFNEQLLSRHLSAQAKTPQERAYLINRDIDAIRGTIIRQTMFAEFEKITHSLAEAGEALTVARFKSVYRELLNLYFGPDFVIDNELELECLRIPHFYRGFYVYKYATGLSAAIALSERVVNGGKEELNAYLNFLKGGCSKYPLELLRDAGVDMETPEPVDAALTRFGELVDELDELL
ncbi:MAG: oligoendopeptidase F [Planctomycetota bacterium]|nr:oligoendopeptidase F [Planctomycetota bacterium]